MKLRKVSIAEDLLDDCRAGKRHAQEMLYRLTTGKMMAVCMRYAKNRVEAEDALQMGYVKIFGSLNRYRGEGSFEGWMKRVMINTAIANYRKNLHMLNIVPIDESMEMAATGFDFGRLGMKDLLKLIQKLADGYRVVFNMYAIEGYSHKEIAQLLGISEGASKSQLSRARAILQKEIIKLEGTSYENHAG